MIPTPPGARLFPIGKSDSLTGQSKELQVARMAQIGRLNELLSVFGMESTPSFLVFGQLTNRYLMMK
jgi:hypothetical protein